jgi:hypothetical protein
MKKEYLTRKDLRQNHHAEAARYDGAKRAIYYKTLKHELPLTASMRFTIYNPCQTTCFLPTAAKSKQKGPLAKLCSSSNYQANSAGRFHSFPTTENSIGILNSPDNRRTYMRG